MEIHRGQDIVIVYPPPSFEGCRFLVDKQLDLAAIPVNVGECNLRFFPMDAVTTGHSNTMRGHYFMAGFPASQNPIDKVNPRTGPKTTAILPLMVKVDQSLKFAKDNMRVDKALGFKHDRVFDEGILKSTGAALNGMSGCGLWYFPNRDPSVIQLAGIFIKRGKGTKIGYASLAKFIREML